jgi:PAS domain S-box-containing protein
MAKSQAILELEQLRLRLEEAEETLQAIRSGQVDALVVSGPHGEQVYTLKGADHSYRVLLQEMNEGAAMLLPDGTLLYCNRRFAEMLDMPLEKVIGISIDSFLAPTDRQSFAALVREGKQGRAKAEVTFALEEGILLPTYCSISPVQIDELCCLCLVATDLTEQKRNEEIVAAEKLARSILEQAADSIVVCDENGTIIQASRAAHELAGTNVLHQSFETVFPLTFKDGTSLSCSVADAEEAFSIAACLGGRAVRSVEVQFKRPDGKIFELLMSAGPLRDAEQRVLGCVFTLSDITERKLAEEKLRRQASELEQQLIASGRLISVGEITASMAHEFNNPLGIVLGFTQDLLTETDPSSPSYQSLKIIHEEAKRCEKIIRDLLQFARPSSADLRLSDVKQLIEKTLSLVSIRLYKEKIEAVVQVDEKLPKIHADARQLEQVLVNLCLNAIDAMPDGGRLTVGAKWTSTASSSRELVISIADTGFGIDDKDLSRIFQPFFTAKKKRGMGLGLTICERIIKNHGGRIEVESQPGRGTTFKVYLPIERLPPEQSRQNSEREGAP